ncbi:hypothetical protein BJ138DRAFT_1140362 [Hygrophoropsis aurantiaca]|uniref:Uncharacterized protein n=1 Tax=Hygrophoropsis aurantiaca TaxID=72124 RepID=A0ACB8AUU9_9AGAM|nr:hypothetical protein BJ138DRAFT_1140362 [Hygrophoropsis aurantiaca]
MSRVIDVSEKLGEYMLKGWVLTDNICPKTECRGCPLMRSPPGKPPVTFFCVACEGDPTPSEISAAQTTQSSSTESSNSAESRPSTPPTELSSTLSSPTFALPVETEEMTRRREQSDLASSEIGKRLLKGWAMLGEECPNTRCYGVPLVRPPKAGGEKDPRKECVVCRTVYTTESDSQGWQRLTPIAPIDFESSLRRENAPSASTSTTLGQNATPRDKGKSVDRGDHMQTPLPLVPTPSQLKVVIPNATQAPDLKTPQQSSSTEMLDSSVQALEQALRVLSQKLTLLCSNPVTVEASSIASVAEGISKVTQALSQVRQLQRQGL